MENWNYRKIEHGHDGQHKLTLCEDYFWKSWKALQKERFEVFCQCRQAERSDLALKPETKINRKKERKMTMTFNELVKNKKPVNEIEQEVLDIMSWANRQYIDDSKLGNYLVDFLSSHGDKEVCPIDASMGCPVTTGRGIWIK